MLSHLSIRDFVIVAALEIDFEPGFTVFSGETGAGKSILLDALSLLLGARADAVMVREGQSRADISAQWEIPTHVQHWLVERDLVISEENQTSVGPCSVLVRRVIEANGRSRAFINAIPVTLNQLRELGEHLVNLHAQQAHQQIVRTQTQRTIFDMQAGLEAQVKDVANAWQHWREAIEACITAQKQAQQAEQERDALTWRLAELNSLGPQSGEWESLSGEHRVLSHGVKLAQGAHEALESLSEDKAILARVGSILSSVRYLAELDPRLNDILQALEPAEIGLQEAAHSLRHYTQTFDLDPERLAEIEARLEAFFALARKLRLAPEAIFAEHVAVQERLAALEAATDRDALLEAQLHAQQHYQVHAARLSKARSAAAPAFSKALTDHMQSLSMAGGRFEVALIPLTQDISSMSAKQVDTASTQVISGTEVEGQKQLSKQVSIQGSAQGDERIEFRFTSHEEGILRPLAQVASGGELARIALALAVVSSATNAVPTLIFDEVDSGVGGAAAEAVGKLLQELAVEHQVLCVTHLPQVTAHAQHHFCVSKTTDAKGHTVSSIAPLNFDARVEEMSRMLGGANLTTKTREHAKEMLLAAEKNVHGPNL